MALSAVHNETSFGIGDRVRVVQRIKEGDKTRLQSFEGMVIAMRGRQENKTFTVRRIGEAQVGIERIFPLLTPTIEKIEVVKKGLPGVRRAKLYYTRDKSRKEVEKIYSRANRREMAKKQLQSISTEEKSDKSIKKSSSKSSKSKPPKN